MGTFSFFPPVTIDGLNEDGGGLPGERHFEESGTAVSDPDIGVRQGIVADGVSALVAHFVTPRRSPVLRPDWLFDARAIVMAE